MIVGTAGHVDHGKSALVEALTGKTMDPLAEERRRGITLDLHFAELRLPDGRTIGIVDVPGHVDLVRTMVAGASGMDTVLLVVAADEGIMPQTREHLAVVEQLRIPAGVPVITKVDVVGTERLTEVVGSVDALLRRSPVAFSQPVAVSARTGQGLNALLGILAARVDAESAPPAGDLARLPIDRAFTLPGTGPVVTGTAWSGSFQVGDTVLVLPAGHRARIKSLGRHGATISRSAPGERLAVALAGVDSPQLARGQVLVHETAPWASTRVLDVQLSLLPDAPEPLAHLTRVRVHLGTLEVIARVHQPQAIGPGGSGLARLVLEAPAVARGGDRLVLRRYSPLEVIGGGSVVDPAPPSGKPLWLDGLTSAVPSERLAALVARRPLGLEESRIPVVLGTPPADPPPELPSDMVRAAGALLARARIDSAALEAVGAVRAYHRDQPGQAGMPLETLRRILRRSGYPAEVVIAGLAGAGRLVLDQAIVRDPAFAPPPGAETGVVDRLLQRIATAGLTPPSLQELAAEFRLDGIASVLRQAAKEGRVEAVGQDRYYSREAIAQFTESLAAVADRGPITPAALRDVTGLSRKFLIPLLEWADRAGLTIRRDDARVPGPRLATVPRR